ncbi:hypothetical protein VHEMI03274 [[Torrubiella] hemipterigena]|uniref:2EXR domain-containing protein n=1 Tax=[Torrubiella] hemipterigena TaxID=1531966 RepID=A0A0A1TAR4_9HYPO|nr:hypothetical protein VHEMI03274 [[Torrubiella] hemipterigena]
MPRQMVLDSDDEDDLQEIQQPVTIHDSDSETGGSEEDSDEDSDDSRPRNGFFDDEAEDDEDDDEEDDDEEDDEDRGSSQAEEGSDEEDEEESFSNYLSFHNRDDKFHPFLRLPIELRMKIWETYCPDLTSPGRVLQFVLKGGSAHLRPKAWNHDDEFLTIWDGRELSDQSYHLRHVMAVHKESRYLAMRLYPDVVKIDGGDDGKAMIRVSRDRDVFFLDHWEDVDVSEWKEHDHIRSFMRAAENLAVSHRTIFEFGNAASFGDWLKKLPNLRHIFVCVEPKVFREAQITDSSDMEWCLSEFANKYVAETWAKSPGIGENISTTYCWPDAEEHRTFATVHVPKLEEDKLVGSGTLKMLKERGVEWWPMAMFFGHRVDFEADRPWRRDSDDDDSDEGFDETNEYESDGIDDTENPEVFESDDGLDDADITAQFSSPEPESPEIQRRPRKRRIVDDDEDEDEVAEASTSRNKRAKIVLDSDDVQIISDDSDDEPPPPARGKRRAIVEESQDESSEEEAPKKLTLAQRLKGKKAVVISDDEEDDEEEEEDEEDEEDDEEEDDEDGLIDGIAMESDGEGDEDEEEEEESYY